MTQNFMDSKQDLLAAIDTGWNALRDAVNQVEESALTSVQDEQGWTAKDHLSHLMGWERSIVFFLQSLPRHEGLGVEEALYLSRDFDAINDAIYQQYTGLSLAETLEAMYQVHEKLLELLAPMTDEDLLKPYRHYLPDEPGEGDGPPAIDRIYGSVAYHYDEHLEWINDLVNKASRR